MSDMSKALGKAMNTDETVVFEFDDFADNDVQGAVFAYTFGNEAMVGTFGRGPAGLHVDVVAYRDGEVIAAESIPSIDGVIVKAVD